MAVGSGLHPDPDHPDRDVDPAVAEHVPDEVGHDPDAVEVGLKSATTESGTRLSSQPKYSQVIAAGGVDHPRRVHLADDDVGEGDKPDRAKRAAASGMALQVLLGRLVVAGALRGVDGDRCPGTCPARRPAAG